MADPLGLPQIFDTQTTRPTPDLRIPEVSSREEAERVAQEFEDLFLAEMLRPMFANLSTEAPFGGGQAEETFRPLLIDEYAKSISTAGGIGIADSILAEILRLQGLE